MVGLSTTCITARHLIRRLGTRAHHLLHNGIKRRTPRALYTEKMPVTPRGFRLAIVAHDIDNPLQIVGHGVFGNVSSSGFPRCGHTLLTDDSLFTNGAAVIKAGKFTKTVGVNCVPARQVLWRLARTEHVFTTDGAVVLVFVLEALVRVKHTDRDAHATFIAVAEGFHAANAAETTLFAVKGFLALQYDVRRAVGDYHLK
jgi:hypothetical protein